MTYVLPIESPIVSGQFIVPRDPARIAFNTNVTISTMNSGVVIQGVTLAVGDRFLLTGQTNPVDNGIYSVNVTNGTAARVADYTDGNSTIIVFIYDGNTFKNTGWINLDSPVVGVDPITFIQFAGPPVDNTITTTSAATLTNKDATSTTNTIYANTLFTTGGNVNVSSATAPTAGQILRATSSTTATWQDVPGGEVNTASNVGGGVGLFKQKTGVDLEFNSLIANTGANTGISAALDGNNNIVLTFNESAYDYGTSNIGSVLYPTNNFLPVLKGGLGNVINRGVNATGVLCTDVSGVATMQQHTKGAGDIIGTTDTQNVVGLFDSITNTITATHIGNTAAASKNIGAAAAPTAGQLLVEAAGNTMTWQTQDVYKITNYQFVESYTAINVTSATSVTVMTLTATSIPAGNYVIAWGGAGFYLSGTNTQSSTWSIELDAVEIASVVLTGGTAPNRNTNIDRFPFSGMWVGALTAATHTVVAKVVSGAATTVSLSSMVIDLFRIV